MQGAWISSGGRPIGLYTLPPEFKFIGQGSIGVLPIVIIIFLVDVVASDFILQRPTFFRKVFYTGSNEKAAAYSGIRTKRVVFFTTTLCSALCGFAGIIYMARFGSAQPTFGMGMELNVCGRDRRRQSYGGNREDFRRDTEGYSAFGCLQFPRPA